MIYDPLTDVSFFVVAKERAKAEKAAKFAAKQAKKSTPSGAAAAPSKKKEKKEEETLAKYVEDTPKGDKKSMDNFMKENFRIAADRT